MKELDPNLYVDREHTYVKHFVLRFYLEKLAYKIGMSWRGAALNYVDGFAGPWQSKSETLKDTSPHIAVRVLRGVRDGLVDLGKPKLGVRAMFVERDANRYQELLASFVGDPDVIVRHGEFESFVKDAVTFGSTGTQPFCFSFIDPCGWTGYGLNAITPLLRLEPGEVLINFMFDEINRFIDHPDPINAATFRDLFGSDDFRDAWAGLEGLDRQEVMVATYCNRIRVAGHFDHVVSAVIINPLKDRAHYHLVYGTRNAEGLRTFRDAERKALAEQNDMRAGAQQREREERTRQLDLFGAEVLSKPYLDELHARYLARARHSVAEMLATGNSTPFDDLAIAGMQQPMISEQDVRDLLMEAAKRKSVEIEGLVGKARKPQWRKGHRVRLLKPA
jgi:three-Cys-motif partner protein